MSGLTRKQLLVGAAAAGAVAGCGGSSPKPFDPEDWASVKAQFALSSGLRHFDAFVLATHPKPVRDAIERHRRGLDADPAGYVHAHEVELDERVAQSAARYLEVNAGDIAMTDSTTMGLGLVYGGIAIKGEPVATEHDFYATHEALRLRFGRFRTIRLYDDPAAASKGEIIDRLKAGVRGDTGLLALTWVHSGTGVRLPLAEIGQALGAERRNGLTVVVDGVHGLATDDEPLSIESYDVLVAGCHKWLGGPRGTGMVWSIKSWERLRPTIPSFHPTPEGEDAATFTPGGYHSFEHRWALAEAFDFHARIGRTTVTKRIKALATRLKEGLAELPKVRLVTPMPEPLSAGIVCFEIAGLDAGTAVQQLRERKIGASVTPYAEQYVRLGTGIWVDEADVDAALDAIVKL